MCGRYAIVAEPGELAVFYQAKLWLPLTESYSGYITPNVLPSTDIVIVRERFVEDGSSPSAQQPGQARSAAANAKAGVKPQQDLSGQTTHGTRTNKPGVERGLELAQWGFIPHWAKESIRPVINARSETCTSKPFFRQAARYNRCIIPVSWYYEWEKLPGGAKQPWMFALPSKWQGSECSPSKMKENEPRDHVQLEEEVAKSTNKLMSLAGLYSQVDEQLTVAIVTRAASNQLQFVHERMPVILEPEDIDFWLDPTVTDSNAVQAFFDRYQAPQVMMAHRQPQTPFFTEDVEATTPGTLF